MKVFAAGVGLCFALAIFAGCDEPKESKGVSPDIGPSSAKCNLNTTNPGPYIRGGLARVRLEGPQVSVDAKNVPALCGSIYNYDIPKLDAKAGDGLLLETCIPEGTIQLTSYVRRSGRVPLHSDNEPGGAEVVFNRNEASSYSSRGTPTDSIVVSADMWKADVNVELHEVMGNAKLRAQITFECPNPSPLELKTAAEKAEAAKAAPTDPAKAAPEADKPSEMAEPPAPK